MKTPKLMGDSGMQSLEKSWSSPLLCMKFTQGSKGRSKFENMASASTCIRKSVQGDRDCGEEIEEERQDGCPSAVYQERKIC
jgi:hypothetical protein